MSTEHVITSADQWFLDKGMIDPVTGERFRVGDRVVICARCHTSFLRDSWNLTGHCANCSHGSTLSFYSFSPNLFQLKASANRGFRVKNSVRFPASAPSAVTMMFPHFSFNYYPQAWLVSVVLPICIAALMFFSFYFSLSWSNPSLEISAEDTFRVIRVEFAEQNESNWEKARNLREKLSLTLQKKAEIVTGNFSFPAAIQEISEVD